MQRRNVSTISRVAGLVLAAALALGGSATMAAVPASATPAPTNASTVQSPILADWGWMHNDGSPQLGLTSLLCEPNGTSAGLWDLPAGAYPPGLQVNFTNDTIEFSKNYPVEDQRYEIPGAGNTPYKVTYRLNDKDIGQPSQAVVDTDSCRTWVVSGDRAIEFKPGGRPVDWHAVRHIGHDPIGHVWTNIDVHLLKEAANSKFRYILEVDGKYAGEYYQGKAYGMTMRENHAAGTIELQAQVSNLHEKTDLTVYLATGEPETTPEMKGPLAVPVEEIKREGEYAAFTFDKNYFNSTARYIITVDGKYSGEIHNGVAYYTDGHRENDDGTITVLDHLVPDGEKHTIAIHIASGAPGDSTEGMHTITTTEMLLEKPPAAVQSITQVKWPTLKAGEAGQMGLHIKPAPGGALPGAPGVDLQIDAPKGSTFNNATVILEDPMSSKKETLTGTLNADQTKLTVTSKTAKTSSAYGLKAYFNLYAVNPTDGDQTGTFAITGGGAFAPTTANYHYKGIAPQTPATP